VNIHYASRAPTCARVRKETDGAPSGGIFWGKRPRRPTSKSRVNPRALAMTAQGVKSWGSVGRLASTVRALEHSLPSSMCQ
jgi:hypothetical protein